MYRMVQESAASCRIVLLVPFAEQMECVTPHRPPRRCQLAVQLGCFELASDSSSTGATAPSRRPRRVQVRSGRSVRPVRQLKVATVFAVRQIHVDGVAVRPPIPPEGGVGGSFPPPLER